MQAMTQAVADIVDSLAEHRRFLHNLASLQLNCKHDAEDAVQNTFAAAIAGIATFSGQVPLRAWLVGILRNKIVDAIRHRARYVQLDDAGETGTDESEFDGMFTENGVWRPESLSGGACPESAMVRHELLELVEFCMQKLPANTAQVFLMREFLGLEFGEISGQLKLAEGNLRVLLYRARMRLRDCVTRGWGEQCHDA